jgi:hypothetical protein
MPRSRTRARNRTLDKSKDPNWPKARRAQLYREVKRRLKKLRAYHDAVNSGQPNPYIVKRPHEKAPDLAAEGSSSSVVPGEVPEPPPIRLRTL